MRGEESGFRDRKRLASLLTLEHLVLGGAEVVRELLLGLERVDESVGDPQGLFCRQER